MVTRLRVPTSDDREERAGQSTRGPEPTHQSSLRSSADYLGEEPEYLGKQSRRRAITRGEQDSDTRNERVVVAIFLVDRLFGFLGVPCGTCSVHRSVQYAIILQR